MPPRKINKHILVIALEALDSRRAELASKIAVVRQALGPGSNSASVIDGRKRTLSAAARKRIAEAQHKRWRLARQKKVAVAQKRAKKKS